MELLALPENIISALNSWSNQKIKESPGHFFQEKLTTNFYREKNGSGGVDQIHPEIHCKRSSKLLPSTCGNISVKKPNFYVKKM